MRGPVGEFQTVRVSLPTFRHEYVQITEASAGLETSFPQFLGPASSMVLAVLPGRVATGTKT